MPMMPLHLMYRPPVSTYLQNAEAPNSVNWVIAATSGDNSANIMLS